MSFHVNLDCQIFRNIGLLLFYEESQIKLSVAIWVICLSTQTLWNKILFPEEYGDDVIEWQVIL